MNVRFYSIFSLLYAMLVSATAQTVPALVNYQGRLANPDGTALATGDYQLTFRVYDSVTNIGGLVWGPQVFDGVAGQGHGGKIPVVQGYFNAMLGPVDTNGVSLAGAFAASNRFVEIRVGTNSPILPRQQILSAPYALNSAALAGYDWSVVFGTNDPTAGHISWTKLAPRPSGTNFADVGGVVVSQSVSAGVSTTAETVIPNLTVTLVTTGRPVMVMLNGEDAESYIVGSPGTGDNSWVFSLYRGSTRVAQQRCGANLTASGTVLFPPSSISFVDLQAGAGTNIYSIRLSNHASPGNVTLNHLHLVAFEL